MSQVGRTPVHVQQSLRHPSWFLSHAPTEAVPDIVLPKGSWRLTTRMKERHSLQSFKAPQPQENAESPHNCWAALDFKLGVTEFICQIPTEHLCQQQSQGAVSLWWVKNIFNWKQKNYRPFTMLGTAVLTMPFLWWPAKNGSLLESSEMHFQKSVKSVICSSSVIAIKFIQWKSKFKLIVASVCTLYSQVLSKYLVLPGNLQWGWKCCPSDRKQGVRCSCSPLKWDVCALMRVFFQAFLIFPCEMEVNQCTDNLVF